MKKMIMLFFEIEKIPQSCEKLSPAWSTVAAASQPYPPTVVNKGNVSKVCVTCYMPNDVSNNTLDTLLYLTCRLIFTSSIVCVCACVCVCVCACVCVCVCVCVCEINTGDYIRREKQLLQSLVVWVLILSVPSLLQVPLCVSVWPVELQKHLDTHTRTSARPCITVITLQGMLG